MSKIKALYALKYGESTLAESLVFLGGNADVKLPISFIVYFIETDDRRILVDAGCDTMPGFEMEHFVSPCVPLAQVGYSPEDITDVIVTHAHHDHIEAVKHFKNAVVHIQAREYESSQKKHKYIPQGFAVNIFEDEAEIDGVRVKRISGHSKGSCIVELLCGGKNYVISGDECYSRKCLTHKIPTGSSFDPEKSIQLFPFRVKGW